jgi:gliding motility-associated-like protein
VNDGTLTRLRFAGCDLPASTLKDPAPMVYKQPGTYYINLLTDVGLPTQSYYCKEIVVKDCCSAISGVFTGNTVCSGNQGMLRFHPTSTVLAPPFTLVYSDPLNSYTQNNVTDNTAFSLSVNPKATTSYTLLKITDSNNCSTDITGEIATVTVNIPATLVITPDTTLCENTSLQLNVSGGQNYIWSPAALLNNPGISNPIAQPTQATKFIVVGKDANQCDVTASVQVNMEQIPVFKKPANVSTCSGIPILLNGNNDPKLLYIWTPADNLDNPAGPAPQAILNQSTDFSVVMTDQVCPQYTSTYTVHVNVNQTPEVRASRSNDIDCSNLISTLSASGANSYSWQPSSNLSNPEIASPIAKLAATTRFIVKGISDEGCSSFDSVTIVVMKTGQNAFSVPNAFTPNGDNLNDCFGIRNWGSVTLRQFTIYNRWGQKVFETNDPNACWDGTFQGVMQPAGGFVYLIRASSFCGDVVKKGNLLLIR